MHKYPMGLRTLAADCNFGNTLVERLLEQLVNGCEEKRIQQELLATDDISVGSVFAIMRTHDFARKVRDLENLKAASVYNVSKKPERGKPQHVAEAVQESMEHDLAKAEKLQDTTEPDVTAVEDILDTTEPDLIMTETLLDS